MSIHFPRPELSDRVVAVAGKLLFAGMIIAWIAVSASIVVAVVRHFGSG